MDYSEWTRGELLAKITRLEAEVERLRAENADLRMAVQVHCPWVEIVQSGQTNGG